MSLLTCININATISEEEIAKGVLDIDAKKYDDAYRFFTNFINENPKNAVGLYYRSIAALGKGDKASALNDINNALKLGGGFMKKKDVQKEDLLVQRGLIYEAMGEYQKAIDEYSAALVENPTHIESFICRGKVYADEKDIEKSDQDFKQALTIDETELRANMGLVKNMLSRNNYQQAIDLLNKLDQLYPETNEIYTLRGDAYVMMGKYKEAFDDACVQIEFQEDYNTAMSQLVSRAMQCYTYALPRIGAKITKGENIDLWLQARASIFQQLDRYDEAIIDYDHLERALKETYAPVCLGRGDCYKSLGDYTNAISQYEKAITLEDTPIAYAQIGAIRMNESKKDSARSYILNAINKDPQNAYFYYLRGRLEESMSDSSGALKTYEEGLTLDRQNRQLLYAQARLTARKDPKTANEIYNNISKDEKVIQAKGNFRALAYARQGKTEDAKGWEDKVLAKFPTASNYYEAGLVYAQLGLTENAINALDQAFTKGYHEYGTLQYESELKSLRQTKEFAELMKKWNISFSSSAKMKRDTTASDSANADMPIIPCTVDGMKLTFTTNNDTARIFTISLLDVQMLVKYGYMTKNDVIAQREQKLDIVNIPVGSKVVLRSFKWGKKELKDVEATIVEDPLAPILITQGMLNEIDK